MTPKVEPTADQNAVTVHVPLRWRRRGGRKLIIGEVKTTEPGKALVQDSQHRTILKALGRAYRWKRLLESGEYASITDLAKAEKINHSYVRRILRLTLLSPEITETLLAHGLSKGQRLETLLGSSSEVWAEQTVLL